MSNWTSCVIDLPPILVEKAKPKGPFSASLGAVGPIFALDRNSNASGQITAATSDWNWGGLHVFPTSKPLPAQGHKPIHFREKPLFNQTHGFQPNLLVSFSESMVVGSLVAVTRWRASGFPRRLRTRRQQRMPQHSSSTATTEASFGATEAKWQEGNEKKELFEGTPAKSLTLTGPWVELFEGTLLGPNKAQLPLLYL